MQVVMAMRVPFPRVPLHVGTAAERGVHQRFMVSFWFTICSYVARAAILCRGGRWWHWSQETIESGRSSLQVWHWSWRPPVFSLSLVCT